MWLSEQDVANTWGGIKNFMGNAWHHGQKVLGTMDRYANLGLRLFGAAANTGLLKGHALESGLEAISQYDKVRQQASRFGRDVDRTVGHFRAAVPELNI